MRLGYGLIGAGFMGKTHTLGFLNVNRIFRLPVEIELRKVAEYDAAVAERAAKSLGYPEFTDDWRALIADPAIHIVSIATPGTMHCEMALAAIAALQALPAGRSCAQQPSRGILDTATGVRLSLPPGLFVRQAATRRGTNWSTADGTLNLDTLAYPEEQSFQRLYDSLKAARGRRIAREPVAKTSLAKESALPSASVTLRAARSTACR